jgi:plastocyanin
MAICSTIVRRHGWLAGGAAALLLALPGGAMASSYTVTMANMNYGRLPSGVKVGDTITWVNNDSVPHTVTARDKSFDLRLSPGQKNTMTASKAGSFPFYCIYHASMRGVLTVSAK